MYAVNVADWHDYRDDVGLKVLLQPVIPGRQMVIAEKDRADGMALVLECDDERASAIVALIRKRYEKHALRCYWSKTGNSWRRV